MSKEFKRCPRCNTKTYIQLKKCGGCGLNFDKFNSATNTEAKSAFRMGEKKRVLYTKKVPSDVSKVKLFFKALLGGWFGLHFFAIGRVWRGLFQILGSIFAFVYSYCYTMLGITSGYLGYLVLMLGFIWVYTFITWLSDTFAILFNKFKYPVSLPYSNVIDAKSSNKQGSTITQSNNSTTSSNPTTSTENSKNQDSSNLKDSSDLKLTEQDSNDVSKDVTVVEYNNSSNQKNNNIKK